MRVVIFTLLIFFASLAHVQAQCNGPSCQPSPGYEWRVHQNDPDRRYLYSNGVLIGGYDTKEDYYRPYSAQSDSWGDKCQPPLAVTRSPSSVREQYPTGVDASKLKGQEHYTLHTADGDHCLTKDAACEILKAGSQLQDDSGKLRITVVGRPDETKQTLDDLARLEPDANSWATVRAYPPEHWSLRPGFVTTGHPTIYCQAPTGKVLHHQDDYLGGGEALVEAIRKAKAGYDPKKDPDLRKTQAPAQIPTQAIIYGLALACGAGAVRLLQQRKAGNHGH